MPGTKYSIKIAGRKTSIWLEPDFWEALEEIAKSSAVTKSKFIRNVAASRSSANLASSIRVAVLSHFRNRSRPR